MTFPLEAKVLRKHGTAKVGFPSCAIEKVKLHVLPRKTNSNEKRGIHSSSDTDTKQQKRRVHSSAHTKQRCAVIAAAVVASQTSMATATTRCQ